MAGWGPGGHRLGHAMRREPHERAFRHRRQILDKDRAAALEPLDDEAIMHDLVADIDRRTEAIDGPLDDLDGALDPRAEAARTGQENGQRRVFSSSISPCRPSPALFRGPRRLFVRAN